MADFTTSTRRPTLRLLRSHDVEPGAQVVLYWSGFRAPNGDGHPGPGHLSPAVDFSTPLVGPLDMWRGGHRHFHGGGWCRGAWPFRGAGSNRELGWCHGPWGRGPWGVGTDHFAWTFNFDLRDGEYLFAPRLADARGNAQGSLVGDTFSLEVAALPRPPSRLTAERVADDLVIRFDPSPEFAAA